jgi:hypothetical protein
VKYQATGTPITSYRRRFSTDAPEIQMRVMTRYRPAGVALADDVPNYRNHSGKFMAKLLVAWIAMTFQRSAR